MIESLRQLIDLQNLDMRIAAGEQELGEIPARREELRAARAAADAARHAATETLERLELDERRLELESNELTATIARLEDQTYEVKSQNAYDTLRHEIDAAKQASSERETRALELLESIDDARAAIDEADVKIERLAQEGAAEVDRLAKREAQLAAELVALRAERGQHARGLKAAVLDPYVLAASRFPALVIVTGNACPSCRIVIPPQGLSNIKSSKAIVSCSSCRRILISQEVVPA